MNDQRIEDLRVFPTGPGTYALIMKLDKAMQIKVGKLGQFVFPQGWYLYVGSALGPGGLTGRLGRHLKRAAALEGSPHWHIDYLLHYTKIMVVWLVYQSERREHHWARCALEMPGVSVPVQGFGSSDCRCPAHLFHFPNPPNPVAFQRLLSRRFPEEELVLKK